MIDPRDFARRQLELTAEFGKYVFDHPEMDERLPEGAYVYFHVEGEEAFNQYSRDLAERRQREDGAILVLVRTKGMSPPQGSRLIDPVIEAPSAAIS
jgi:hypothetical protein